MCALKLFCLLLGMAFVVPYCLVALFLTLLSFIFYNLFSLACYILFACWWRIPWLLFMYGKAKSAYDINRLKFEADIEKDMLLDIFLVDIFKRYRSAVEYFFGIIKDGFTALMSL